MSNVGKRVNVIDKSTWQVVEENAELLLDYMGYFKTFDVMYDKNNYHYSTCETHKPKSILLQAEEIVNGSRANDYGGTEGLKRIAQVVSLLRNKEFTAVDVTTVMLAVKLVRESFKHKEDNLLDAVAYIKLLNDIENEK